MDLNGPFTLQDFQPTTGRGEGNRCPGSKGGGGKKNGFIETQHKPPVLGGEEEEKMI